LIFQIQGRYRIKDSHLKILSEKVKSLAAEFEAISFQQVPRETAMIKRADELLNQTLDQANARAPQRRIPPATSSDSPHGGLF
jgi:hypothetical protein